MNTKLLIFINIFAALISLGLLLLAAHTQQHTYITGLIIIISGLFSWLQSFESFIDIQTKKPSYPWPVLGIGGIAIIAGYLWEVLT